MTKASRRGWREKIEPGLYRAHRVACPSSSDHRTGRRCTCPYELQVPGERPGRTRSVTFIGSAREARQERRRRLAAGRPAASSPQTSDHGAETLDEFAGQYLRARAAVLEPHTIATTERAYRLRVSPELGGLALGDITRERIELWLVGLRRVASSRRMVVGAVAALRVILSAAVEWERLASNPAKGLRLPPPPTQEIQAVERVLDPAQVNALLTLGTTRLRVETMLRAAAETGLRRGEVIGLRWPDVNLVERRLEVRRSVWQATGPDGRPTKGVKTAKGRRARRVAISHAFAARLAEWYSESVVEGGADASGHVWPGRRGEPMDAGTPTQALARAAIKSGLVDDGGRPLVTFHGLRHTAASIMLAHDVPLIVVSRQLGHVNPQVTAEVYAHLLNDSQLDLAAGAFEELGTGVAMGETMGERKRIP